MEKERTIWDVANALGVSIGTVSRALNDRPGVKPVTRTRVLQMAKTLRFRPHLGARLLSSKRRLRISANLPAEPAFFWDAVREGMREEARLFAYSGVEMEFRSFVRLDSSEEAALDEALQANVNAIILAVAGSTSKLRSLIHKASGSGIPIVSIGTNFLAARCLASVSTDALISSAVAGELLSRMTDGPGKLAMLAEDSPADQQKEVYDAFREGARSCWSQMQVLPLVKVVKDRGGETKLAEKCRKLLLNRANLGGLYASTANINLVMNALRQTVRPIPVIAANLSPDVMQHLELGHLFAAFYQRPRCQGRIALRLLHDFLIEKRPPLPAVRLAPYLITRGSLHFFLQQLDAKGTPAQMQHKQEAGLRPQNHCGSSVVSC